MMTTGRNVVGWWSVALLAFCGAPVMAASHLWRFNEIFSTADGTIQFIELKECCGADNETFLLNKWVSSDATGHEFTFPENLDPPTGNQYLLLATAGFAALPGAPTPDYIIQDGFFALNADMLRYWTYPAATMTFSSGDLPTNGIHSLNIDGSTGVNSPTNFAGDSGQVAAVGPGIPTLSEWGFVAMAVLLLTIGTMVFARRRSRTATA